jgi:hypothetical protein
MTPKVSQPANPKKKTKKDKGGRPRKKGTNGSTSTTWKAISHPASSLKYEISSHGQVRRLLRNGTYYDVKPWVTGGPYAAVYIYGLKHRKRNRGKFYIHRLVADHFVSGKSSKKVVHHTSGPASNTKSTLEWVTPSENSKARRFFDDEGQRRKRGPKAPKKKFKKKVKVDVPPKKNAVIDASAKSPQKPVPAAKVKKEFELPSDEKVLYRERKFSQKLNYLLRNLAKFNNMFNDFKQQTKVSNNNFLKKFEEVRKVKGKGLDAQLKGTPPTVWYKKIVSAMQIIKQNLSA